MLTRNPPETLAVLRNDYEENKGMLKGWKRCQRNGIRAKKEGEQLLVEDRLYFFYEKDLK